MSLSFYLSSPFRGLQQERAAVKKAVTENNHAYKDSYEASADPVIASCLADVEGCDIYILLLAYRYGTRTDGGQGPSITELEFDQALQSGKPIYAYFLNFILDAAEGVETDPVGQERLKQFKEKVGSHGRAALCSSLQDLAERIQRLAANPPALASDRSGTPATKTYTPAELDDWVATHQAAVERQFLAIPAVQDRSLHVDLPVDLHAEGSTRKVLLLHPAHLALALEGPGAHLILITAEGGAGKTSLAFRIARWGLDGELGLAAAGAAAGPSAPSILPVLIDTALAEGETVQGRVRLWLEQATGAAGGSLEEPLVAELLRRKRLLVILDHFSELSEAARQRVLRTLPTGLLVITSRQPETSTLGDRASTRIEPLQIAIDQLQRFFHEVLECKEVRQRFTDDNLEPTQRQLRRMVGDKPITPLLALMFIEDVIAKQEGQGVLAASVPELMLGYVNRISEVIPPEERRQAGVAMEAGWVQQGLMAIALASHRQGPPDRPRLQPMSFRRELALAALDGVPGLEERQRRQALIDYLLRLRLLHHPGQDTGEFRLALDPLADYLAALRQLELLAEAELRSESAQHVWDRFLAPLEQRPAEDLPPMEGFLLALRDGCQERIERPHGAATIPAEVPDRLGRLAGIEPEEERRRQQIQRVRKLIYELAVPEAEDRLRAIQVLVAMGGEADAAPRQAARQAVVPLVAVLRDGQRQLGERQETVSAMAVIGGTQASEALLRVFEDGGERVELRRGAAEALGRIDAGREAAQTHWRLLEKYLRGEPLREETSTERIPTVLPLLQGASRGLQLLAARALPLWGRGAGRPVPMLTLTTSGGAVSTEVVEVAVWQLPLPGGVPLEVVAIPEGEFLVGSPPQEEGRDAYGHRPEAAGLEVEAQRKVKVPAFAMARTPITQAQWRTLVGPEQEPLERDLNPDPSQARGARLPVECVSWYEAREWCARLNRHLGSELGEAAPRVELPSEAQWEYACRAGTSTPFHCGDTIDAAWANYDATYVYGAGRKGVYVNRPTPVGAYGLVNPWGLADLHGNVWEWCQDLWHPSPEQGPTDGSPWLEPAADLSEAFAQQRLLRGGSWNGDPGGCRSACRDSSLPGNLGLNVGFRVCCLPPGSAA